MTTTLDRRAMLAAALGSLMVGATAADQEASIAIDPQAELNPIPHDYLGFSIEKMALDDPSVYHAENRSLVAFYRRLTPNGVLRVGGNTSEYCWWNDGEGAKPPAGRAGFVPHEAWHTIVPAAIDNLAGFLDVTGWHAIWGLNFGLGDAAMAAHEARYVAGKLGPRLLYFQIGNEPDFYDHRGTDLRGPGWSFDTFFSEWIAMVDAVTKAVPQARFGAPDAGASADWVVATADRAKARLAELTSHYYVGGPDMPDPTAGLLKHDPVIDERMAAIVPAAQRAALPYRMSEGNSIYRGGKAGVSNAFVAALWGFDYLLNMAALGCKGVNFHAGSGRDIAAGLGGRLVGARDTVDLLNARLGTFYSPIAGDRETGYGPRPLFYGMMAAQPFAGIRLVRTTIEAGGANATAYAGLGPQGWRIAIINKDANRDLLVSLPAKPLGLQKAALWRLSAPDLAAETGVTLAGAEVAPVDAAWTPRPEMLQVTQDELRFALPRATAAVILARPD